MKSSRKSTLNLAQSLNLSTDFRDQFQLDCENLKIEIALFESMVDQQTLLTKLLLNSIREIQSKLEKLSE